MSDLHDELDREARRVRGDTADLARVHRRAERLRNRRRVTTAIVALAVGGAGLAVSYAAFSGPRADRPAAGPTQSATPSDDKPSFRIDNHTGVKSLPYKVGFVVGHMFDTSGFSEESVPIRETTGIRFRDEGEEGAHILEQQLLPGAPVREGVPPGLDVEQPQGGADVVLILGSDYTSYPLATAVRALELAERFAARREAGSGAEGFLSPTAADQYERHDDGLQLYSYWPEGQSFDVSGPMELPEDWVTGQNDPHLTFGVRIVATQRPQRLENPDEETSFFTFQEIIEEDMNLELQDDGSFLVSDVQRLPTPAPGPSPTPTGDDATPAPVAIELEDGTGVSFAEYAREWIDALGRGAHHGGYQIAGDIAEAGEVVPTTTIYSDPLHDEEATRMERILFPGAEISGQLPDDGPGIQVVLGEDFAQRHTEALAAFDVVGAFGNARIEGSPVAKDFLTQAAARYYEEDDTASLFEYATGNTYDVGVTEAGGIPRNGKPGFEFDLTFYETVADYASERVRVYEVAGDLKIVEVSFLVFGGSS